MSYSIVIEEIEGVITIHNQYVKTAVGIYASVFLLGMGNIILSAHMAALTKQLNTNASGISFMITAYGIGKLLSYPFTGTLSDKFGRKPLILCALIFMTIFFIGIPLSSSYGVAFFFAFIYGLGNSALDAGSYPALTESFPNASGTANVLVKAFMSIGAMILPLMINFLANHEFYYGYSFYFAAVLASVTIGLMLFAPFPNHVQKSKDEENVQTIEKKFKYEPRFIIEGMALIFIGFTSMAQIYSMQIWLPSLGQEIFGMKVADSINLLTDYSFGSLISVIFLAFLLKKIKPVTILIVYPILTVIAIVLLLTINGSYVAMIGSFFIGLSVGGVFQVAITVMTELFWRKKGTMTGMISIAGSLAAIFMPMMTAALAKVFDIEMIFLFNACIAGIGIVAGFFIYHRYRNIIVTS